MSIGTLVRIERSTRKEEVMQSAPKVSSAVALALSIVSVSFASSALAGPKEEVGAATLAWGQALGEDDPETVLAFYSDDAVLWGTLSTSIRSDRAALRDYFVTAQQRRALADRRSPLLGHAVDSEIVLPVID